MATTETHTPRLTVSEVARALLERPDRAPRVPTFSIKQEPAPGKTVVTAIDVYVPVCDEYPTTEQAFAAALDFTERARARFPLPDGYNAPVTIEPALIDKLRESVKS